MVLCRNNKGFTLVEMLIAMAIFVTFIGILISSYTSIVKAQRDANQYRETYVEARQVFDVLVQELRDGMVDYQKYPAGIMGKQKDLYLISKDNSVRTHVVYKNNKTIHLEKEFFGSAEVQKSDLNSENVEISDFGLYVSPAIDPYDQDNFANDKNQFHPKVTIFAEFKKDLGPTIDPIVIDLQTTVSSRIYNQIYENEI